MARNVSRIVIADEAAVGRHLIRFVLEDRGYVVVGEGTRARDAVDLARTHRPDAVVLHERLIAEDRGLWIAAIRSVAPSVRIVVLSVDPAGAIEGLVPGDPRRADLYLEEGMGLATLPLALQAFSEEAAAAASFAAAAPPPAVARRPLAPVAASFAFSAGGAEAPPRRTALMMGVAAALAVLVLIASARVLAPGTAPPPPPQAAPNVHIAETGVALSSFTAAFHTGAPGPEVVDLAQRYVDARAAAVAHGADVAGFDALLRARIIPLLPILPPDVRSGVEGILGGLLPTGGGVIPGPTADLSISMTGPDQAIAGRSLAYQVVVRNAGPNAASDVAIIYPLDGALTDATACVARTGVTCQQPGDLVPFGGVVSIDRIPPGGSATVAISAIVAPSTQEGTRISSVASVNAATPDPNGRNNDTSAAPVLTTIAARADLSISKTDDGPATAGRTITYTLDVANAGPSDARNVEVTDRLPGQITEPRFCLVTSQTQCGGGDFAPYPTSNVIQLGTLSAGGASTVMVRGTIDPSTPDGATLRNEASVASSTPDPNPANDDTVATRVTAPADLALSVDGVAGDQVAGDPAGFDYTLVVTNAGPFANGGFTVTDTLPAGFSFEGSPDGCSVSPEGFVCIANGLPADVGPIMFHVHVSVPASVDGGSYVNEAAITATATTDPDPSNDTAQVLTHVAAFADLSITADAAGSVAPDLVFANDDPTQNLVTFVIGVTNAGPSWARGVLVTDPLPAGTSFVSASSTDCTPDAGSVTCALPHALTTSGNLGYTIVASVDPALRGGEANDFLDTATVSADTPDVSGAVYPKSASSGTIRVHTVPDAPATVSFVVGPDGIADVVWEVPPADGDEPIDGYLVTIASPTGGTVPEPILVPARPTKVRIPGLDPAQTYTAAVQAHNAVGYGDPITSDPATPQG